jgi:GT2 family glycosyltransferase
MISVLTPSLPERAAMLEECRASVRAQQGFLGGEHLVLVDRDRRGVSATTNELARRAQFEWLWVLADDDLLSSPRCLVAHLEIADEVDIVYSRPIVIPGWYCPACGRRTMKGGFSCSVEHEPTRLEPLGAPDLCQPLEPPRLPASTLFRRSLWERLGGYDEAWTRAEDQELHIRAQQAGARFAAAPDGLWTVRQHPGSKTSQQITPSEQAQWDQAGVT